MATSMEHRKPLADMYLERSEELINVFQESSNASRELVLPVWLEQVDSMQPLAFER